MCVRETGGNKKAWPWAAVLLWMVVIFLFSAQNGQRSGDTSGSVLRWILRLFYWGFDAYAIEKQTAILELWHLIVRKGAHFTEYAVLAMLVANALRQYALPQRLRWILPVAVSAAYAVTDEIHQYFVPDRACRLLDVGIDTCGAIFGMFCFTVAAALRKREKRGTIQ